MNQSISSEMLANTAMWMAAVRGRESDREDRLFNDPWATELAGDVGEKWITDRSPESVLPIVLRVRYFDDYLLRITTDFGIRQVVFVGAGLDTRAWRLDWVDGVKIFEVDQLPVLQYKNDFMQSRQLSPRCERTCVGENILNTRGEPVLQRLPRLKSALGIFRRDNIHNTWGKAVLDAGFDSSKPSLWLLEGFLFYLSQESIIRVLDEVSSLAAEGSWLGFDIINSVVLTSPYTKPWLDMQASLGAPWIGTLDEPVKFLAERGWIASMTQGGHPGVNFGRWVLPVYPVDYPGMPHHWLVTAQKQDR